MTAIGTDCDIVLFNPGLDAGAGIGCLLDRNRISRGGVNVFRAAYKQADGNFQDSQVITFTVLLGDSLTNPDGSIHPVGRSEEYRRLFEILNRRSEIGVMTNEGVYSGLFSNGHYAIEDHAANVSRITLQLSSEGDIFAPADRDRFEQSVWVDDGVYSGSMSWNNSYWRT
jgi:hypothetical protein